MKKLLVLMLTVVMLFAFGTVAVFASEAEETTVAKVNGTEYTTFADALNATKDLTGDVVVEIYDKVTLNASLSGSYTSIKFVGMTESAEIYLEVQGYITATGKAVAFEDITLSKSVGGFIANAGFMNVAFGIFDVNSVNYTRCVFKNGSYASSGVVTYTACTFYRSHDKYGLWAYGDTDVTVDNCVFADYRGIKMYAEDQAKTTELTVKDTNFSALTDKPAIVLTYGESVSLEGGNTYSSTGTFELDLDGAPNGTAIEVADGENVTCKNDNGACGVIVDGKIYTTVAQAAEVAKEGSTVTLLHNTTEKVEFTEGVTVDTNGYTAENVSVAVSVPKGTINGGLVNMLNADRTFLAIESYIEYANESIVIKIYDANGTLLATTSLVDNDRVLLGKKNFGLSTMVGINCTDSWWDTTWEKDKLRADYIPATATLFVDGLEMNTANIKMRATGSETEVIWSEVPGVPAAPVAQIGNKGYETLEEAITAAQAGETVTLLDNVTLSEILVINKSITLDGNGKTLTSSAARAINVTGVDGVTIKNLTIECSGERAINIIQNATNVTIDNVTATAYNYTVNVASSAPSAIVTINNSTLTGLNVVNVASPNAQITVNGGTLVCNDQDENEAYAALALNNYATGATITATGVTFDIKGDSAEASDSTEDGKITIDDIEQRKNAALIDYGDNSYSFATLEEAIKFANAGETIKLISDVTVTEKFSLTDVNIDLNGKTLYLKTTGNYIVNTVKISNGTIDISGGTAENGKSYFTVGGRLAVDGSVLTLDNVNLTGKDYASEWAVICVHNDTTLNMTNCVVSLENDLGKSGGFLKDTSGNSNTATINISNTELTLTNIDRGFTGAKVTLDTVDLTITGGEHGINGSELTVKDSTVSISNGTGRGITLNKFNSSIENSEITLTNMGEGGIRFKTANQLTVDENSTLSATTAHADVEGATINNVAVTGTEDNMSNVTVSENVTTVENPVYLAQIGDNKYTTLADAITAAKVGDTIVITDNIVLETGVVVGADKNITIDLNGYTVSMVDSSSTTSAMIKNNGNLTIVDSSEEKTGKLTFKTTTPSAANAYASNTISNYGTLVVENGTIENTSTGSACYAIDGYANSTTIINGGYMSATKTAVRVFDWTTGSNTSLKIAGGHIYSAAGYAVNFNMGNTPAVSFEVTGGTLETADTTYNLAVYVASKGSAENVTINVTNGEFLGNFALNGVTSTTMSEGNVAITGGTFDGGVICYDTPAYGFVSGGTFTESFDEVALADGYVLESTENGYAPEVATLEDIITFKGYSISENGVGVTAGYTVDKALFENYCKENGEINLGVVFAATQIDANAIYKSFAGLDLTTNYNVSLKDMKEEHLDLEFVMALYVEANGTKQFVTADETGATVLVESTQVEAITYNSVAGQTKEDNE